MTKDNSISNDGLKPIEEWPKCPRCNTPQRYSMFYTTKVDAQICFVCYVELHSPRTIQNKENSS